MFGCVGRLFLKNIEIKIDIRNSKNNFNSHYEIILTPISIINIGQREPGPLNSVSR